MLYLNIIMISICKITNIDLFMSILQLNIVIIMLIIFISVGMSVVLQLRGALI